MKIEILQDNEWLQLRKVSDPEKGVGGYVYSHEIRCDGHIISILPYRFKDSGQGEILIREEVTPCWSMEKELSSITGGFEKDKHATIIETVIEELKEEAGYIAEADEIYSLGIIRGTKSTDTIYHLFTIDVTGKEQGEATGDGSELEAQASNRWVSEIPENVSDPLIYALAYRLQNRFS